jgi:hypothetical protein
VPKDMFEFWKARDPIARCEKFLTERGLWDAKTKAEIDARIERELDEDQKFAEESPLPEPETAEQGVYCEGCHTIEPDWRRPKQEVMPPAASIEAIWKVADFGAAAAASAAPQHAHAKPHSKPPQLPERRPAAQQVTVETPKKEAAAQNISEAPPLRVPFGRGPKDRAFEREQKQNQPAKPHRHGKRRR